MTVSERCWFMALLVLVVFTVLALSGCSTAREPRIVMRDVAVPVAVKCAEDPGPKPAFVDTPEAIRAAPNIFEKVRLVVIGRLQRDGWIAQLEAANAGCR